MKKIIIGLLFIAALLHVGNALLGRPLADKVRDALEKHEREIDEKIKGMDNGNL